MARWLVRSVFALPFLFFLCFFSALSWLTPRQALAAPPLDLPELAARARPSVVLLTIGDGQHERIGTGTGFFVSKDGRIVTNHHVIEDAARVTATLSDGRKVDVLGILADDEKRDIAILQARPGEGEYTPLSLGPGDGKSLRVGDEIVVIGSPRGLSASLSAGLVSAIRERGLSDELKGEDGASSWGIQITAAISPGSSGSPVMNRDGDVVGVAVGFVSGEGLNFSIPVDVPKSMLAAIAPGAKPRAFGGQRSVGMLGNLGISAAVLGVPYLVFVLVRKRAASRRRGGKGGKGPALKQMNQS
jgi:S1-C subfamily serine protease